MKATETFLLAAAVAAVLALFGRKAQAAVTRKFPDYVTGDDTQWLDPLPIPEMRWPDPLPIPEIVIDESSLDDLNAKVKAFLFAIRRAEHRSSAIVSDMAGLSDYFTFFGGSVFYDLSNHPVLTGEKAPIKLSASLCAKLGYRGDCYTTAAGAYQFIVPTWERLQKRLNLPDFSIESQDAAAVELLREIGVIQDLENNDIESAIFRASSQWASLPGSASGQAQRSLSFVIAAFENGLREG